MVVERKLYVDLYFLGNKIFLQYTLKMKTLVFIKKTKFGILPAYEANIYCSLKYIYIFPKIL